ncbi:MAG: ATP-binding protein [Candidatus Pacebacteria bacterium]|jgi:anti-sigma regulatory factor (Ser/Thr protein kinase)|nr:ATP-binding protein [Candidatus Paceibacterota bacterium]
MKIFLSNQGNLRNFSAFAKSLDLSQPDKLEISAHDKWVTVHPANLVLVAALAIKAGKENSEIVGRIPETGRYLDRMGLYDLVKTPSPFIYNKKEEAGRFVPVQIIKTQEDQSRFIADMIPLLHLSEKNARVVKYVIGELVRNVLEHAFAKDGAIVAAQYYKKTNRVSIGICDTGIGIWKSLRECWHPKTDIEAIRLALTPGITGTTRREGGTAENAGAGLFFIKSLAKITRNYFAIYSGNSEYTLLKHKKRIKGMPRLYADPTRDSHNETDNAPSFRGTLVAVDISLDENREFNDLLYKIGEIYDKAIRERKRVKYKEPRFI